MPGTVPGAYQEIRVYRHPGIGYLKMAYVSGDVTVGVVQYQALYSVTFEQYGSVETAEIVSLIPASSAYVATLPILRM